MPRGFTASHHPAVVIGVCIETEARALLRRRNARRRPAFCPRAIVLEATV